MRVIILDIDGTLMDTNYLHVEAWAQAFATVGHPIPRSAIHRQIGKGSQRLIEQFVQDETLGKRVDALHSEMFPRLQPQSYPLPGAKDLLAALSAQEVACWLATSAKPEELAYYIEQLEAADRITDVVSSQDVEQAKPASDIFELTLSRAGCRAEDGIVVGDTVWDIQAANGCGLRTVAVLTGGAFSRQELEAAGAVAIYQDCAELLAAGFPANLI
jgi:HAD superfamily hydrolase (TIGR01509 family)